MSLACSIFDYLVDDLKEIKDLNNCDKITRIIVNGVLTIMESMYYTKTMGQTDIQILNYTK